MAKSHNVQFAALQEAYLKTRDPKCLGKMYLLCVEIATNYIAKYARERGLSLDIPGLSHDSAMYAIEQYLKKPEFKIKRISAYMYFGCIKTMSRDKDRDQREAVSYDEFLLNEEAARAGEASPDENGPGLDRVKASATGPGVNPQGGRHEPAILKQWLLFEDTAMGEDYEEIEVQK
jgi:hypothetical protein